MSTPCVQVWCFCQCTEASPCVRLPEPSRVCRWSRNCSSVLQNGSLCSSLWAGPCPITASIRFLSSSVCSPVQFPEACHFISVLPRSTFVLHAPLIVSRSYLVLWFLPCNMYKAVDIQFFRCCCWMSSICFAICFFFVVRICFSSYLWRFCETNNNNKTGLSLADDSDKTWTHESWFISVHQSTM